MIKQIKDKTKKVKYLNFIFFIITYFELLFFNLLSKLQNEIKMFNFLINIFNNNYSLKNKTTDNERVTRNRDPE